jgi:hypothetical protein
LDELAQFLPTELPAAKAARSALRADGPHTPTPELATPEVAAQPTS